MNGFCESLQQVTFNESLSLATNCFIFISYISLIRKKACQKKIQIFGSIN